MDVNLSNPTTTMVFSSDFGAALDLIAKETDNCSQNNRAAVCIAHVTHNCRNIECDEHDQNNNALATKKPISKCDRWIGFIGTLEKGKTTIS